MIAQHHFEELGLEISYSQGARYLEGYTGSKDGKEEWIKLEVKE